MTTPREFLENTVRRIKSEKDTTLAPLKQAQAEYRREHSTGNREITYRMRALSQMYNSKINNLQNMFMRYNNLMQMTDDQLRTVTSNKSMGFNRESALFHAGLGEANVSTALREDMAMAVLGRRMTEDGYKLYISGRKTNIEVDPSNPLSRILAVHDTRPQIHPLATDIFGSSMIFPSQRNPKYREKPNEDDYSERSDP